MSRSKHAAVKRFIIFLIDGVSADSFDRFVADGKLPTLKRYINEGTYHNNVVASFPTVTGPGHIPLFAGFNPSSLDFVGHNQFDRSRNRLDNYLLYYHKFGDRFGDRDSLYKRFGSSVSLGEPFSIGATRYRKNIFALADWANIRGPANWYVLRGVKHEYAMGRDLIVAWLHETDALAHLSRNDKRIEKSLIALDKFVAKFARTIDDQTMLVFCSDHGMQRVNGKPLSLKLELKKLGSKLSDNRLFLDGGGFGQIYFKKNGDFAERLNESFLNSLPGELVRRDGVDLALYRRRVGKQEYVVVRSREGSSLIQKDGEDKYVYLVDSGRDPLGIINDNNAHLFSAGLSRHELLRLTGNTNYPDGIFQIFELLAAPSSGDLVVTSGDNRGFNLLTRFAVHGGPGRAQAVTFFLFNRPIAGLQKPTLTTADLPNLILSNRAKNDY